MDIPKQHKKAFILLTLLLTTIFFGLQFFSNNNFAASGTTGTQVGGTLTNNTTWTAANSPYIIDETIQIPENVTLTIEPAVTVTAQPSINTMFLINGVIQAKGNATNKIIFDGNTNANFFKTNHPVAKGFLNLDYCIVRNGQSAFWFDNTAYMNLTYSDLSNLSQTSYLWYPSQDSYIEFNTFTNCSGIKIGTDDFYANSLGIVYVKYNLFINNQGYVINNYASYGLSKIIVNSNSFTNTLGTVLEVEQTSTTADMDASQNYWGTANTTIIDSLIYDKNDDTSCSSYINYLPILDAPDPDAPIAPTPPSPTPTPTDTPAPTISASPTPEPSPTPSLASDTNPTSTPSPTNSTSPSSTINPNTNQNSNQNPNSSTPPSNPDGAVSPQNSPIQQQTAADKPTVANTPNDYAEIIIIIIVVVVLLSGLIVVLGKRKP